MGIARDGSHRPDYQPGIELHARYTFFAEGARGHLTKRLTEIFKLRDESGPQVFGLGVKELWDVPAEKHKPGRVIHTQGWPLSDAWGGGFLYHQENGQVALGFVLSLDYSNPYLSPFEEFQRWKTHPAIRAEIEGGRRVSYGARAINEGGYQAIPKLVFPGGALIGCSAGFVNVPRIKGTHTAMKSAMLAAEAAFEAISNDRSGDVLEAYPAALDKSWVVKELKMVRNAQPAVAHWGGLLGTLYAGLDMWLDYLGIGVPWTLKLRPDNTTLKPKAEARPIDYPKADGVLTFDRLSSVFVSNTNHEEDQPVHLTLKDPDIPTAINLPVYAGPEQRYCPAGVYEFVEEPRRRAAAADQRPELRSLQNLRHQGPDPEHQLGHARRRRRTQLSEHVAGSAAAAVAALVAAPAPAAAKFKVAPDDPGLTYMQARAASLTGDHARPRRLLATLAESQPDQVDLARKALSEAISAGQMELALDLTRRSLPAQLTTDAKLLLAAQELRRNKPERALPWLNAERDSGEPRFPRAVGDRVGGGIARRPQRRA